MPTGPPKEDRLGWTCHMAPDSGCLCLGELEKCFWGQLSNWVYKTRHHTTCMHACLCLCTCAHKHVHTLCSLGPCGTLQPGMLRTSYLGEFGGHQLGHQLV